MRPGGSGGSGADAHRQALRDLCNLLVAAVSLEMPVGALERIDWPTVIALAHSYRTLAVLANSRLADEPSLPAGVRMVFRDVATGTSAAAEAIAEQIGELTRLMNDAGVVPMFMKGGAYVIQQLYPRDAMRVLSDIDILLPEERVKQCSHLLTQAGYLPTDKLANGRWHHWYGLAHPAKPLLVELHRWPISFPYSRSLRAEDMLEAGVVQRFRGSEATVPSHFHAAALAIAHSQMSDRDYLVGRVELRRLVDIVLLSRRDPEAVSDTRLRAWFCACGAATAFEYHQRWMDFMLGRVPGAGKGLLSELLYRRALYLSAHPGALSLSVRTVRPWIALRRDLSDPVLRRELATNIARPRWWKRQLSLFSEKRPEP